MPAEFVPSLTIADSISTQIVNSNTILTGIGNELHLFRIDTKSTNKRHVIARLKGKIHGIEIADSSKCLIYGEKEFLLLQWNEQYEFSELFRSHLSDWIITARFLDDGGEFVLLTAHSVLLSFSYESSNGNCKIIARASCSDKSTLYCGTLFGDSWQELVAFGGNAFGELLIWQPSSIRNPTSSEKCPLLQRISAHCGVIFSINYNQEQKLLITTSDDRSVRIWRVSDSNSNVDWATATLTMLASGYGHLARVFQGKVINYDNNEPYIITGGEDSYFCLWDKTGRLLYKRRQQFGAIIWNFAYDESNHIIYTVGSTGNLLGFDLKEILKTKGIPPCRSLKLPDENVYVSKIKFLRQDLMVGITNHNNLVYKNAENEVWETIFISQSQKFTVLEVYRNFIAICGYKNVKLFSFHDNTFELILDDDLLPGLIRSFVFLADECFLISDDKGKCKLFRGKAFAESFNIELVQCKEPWVTSAALLVDNIDEWLVIGNRMGQLLLYSFNTEIGGFNLCDKLRQAHGNLGVTTIKFLGDSEEGLLISTTGHDGSIKTFCIEKSRKTIKILSKEIVPIAWIEATSNCNLKDSRIDLVLGFNDNHFVVWNGDYDVLLQVSCGGGHRSWHYFIYKYEEGVTRIAFAFVQHRAVVQYDLSLLNEMYGRFKDAKIERNQWHVKSCNVMEIFQSNESNQRLLFIVSAGDDNLVKISSFSKASDNLKQEAEIHSHISNIRTLKTVKLDFYKYLLFSCGGRAQLCITQFCTKSHQVRDILSYTIKPLNCRSGAQHSSFAFDPETRIMSVDVYNESSEYTLYLGCSDGYLRKIDFNFLTNSIELVKEQFYGRCILQVRVINQLYVLAAATDGQIRFYNLDLSEIIFVLPLHSSGINALDTVYESKTQILHLLSGGDDQSVHYTVLDLTNSKKPQVKKSLHLKNLHTAQVTAAALLHNPSNDQMYAITSGVDQTLVKSDLETGKIIEETHSCVADIKGLCSTQGLCLLYGCGLQVFKFNNS